MLNNTLLISAMTGLENCAANLSRQLQLPVDSAVGRKEAIAALRRGSYALVILDETLADADLRGAELIWRLAGLAIPMQVNLALSGTARLAREVRSALARREQEQALAMRAAASSIESQLKSTVTGLLLQSQLALAEPSLTGNVAGKLKLVVELAGNLRLQLERAQA